MKRRDKERASYYNYYATTTWGDVNNYDLVLDTGKIGYDGTVEMILAYIAIREKLLGGK